MSKRIGIWIRVSTEDQVQSDSPEHHEHRAKAYAEVKGWIVAEIYHLEAVSDKSVINHQEAQRMIGDVRNSSSLPAGKWKWSLLFSFSLGYSLF